MNAIVLNNSLCSYIIVWQNLYKEKYMTKEQELEKEIERLRNEIDKKKVELEAKGIDPIEFTLSRPMGTYVSSDNA